MAGSAPLSRQSSRVKSATRTLDIIEYAVSQGRPLVAQEIATALAIPVSSLSYLLATLVEREYLQREGRRYSAGPGLQRLQARETPLTLAERGAPLVRALRVQLNETTSFCVRAGWEIEAIATETSDHALRYSVDPGTRAPMHALPSGKVLLAALPPEALDTYFSESERAAFTEATIIDEAALRAQLDTIRAQGWAETSEEFSPGIAGVGQLVTIDGEAVGALSVDIPKVRFTEDMRNQAKALLQRTAALMDAG